MNVVTEPHEYPRRYVAVGTPTEQRRIHARLSKKHALHRRLRAEGRLREHLRARGVLRPRSVP